MFESQPEVRARLSAAPAAGSLPSLQHAPDVVVVVDRVRKSTVRALGYGATLEARRLSGVHVCVDAKSAARLTTEWDRRLPGLMLTLVDADGRSEADALRRLAETEATAGTPLVVIVPERRRRVRAALGLATPSCEIVEALQDVPNTRVVLLPV